MGLGGNGEREKEREGGEEGGRERERDRERNRERILCPPCEKNNTERRGLSPSQKENSHQNLSMLAPKSQTLDF